MRGRTSVGGNVSSSALRRREYLQQRFIRTNTAQKVRASPVKRHCPILNSNRAPLGSHQTIGGIGAHRRPYSAGVYQPQDVAGNIRLGVKGELSQ